MVIQKFLFSFSFILKWEIFLISNYENDLICYRMFNIQVECNPWTLIEPCYIVVLYETWIVFVICHFLHKLDQV